MGINSLTLLYKNKRWAFFQGFYHNLITMTKHIHRFQRYRVYLKLSAETNQRIINKYGVPALARLPQQEPLLDKGIRIA